MEHKKGFRDIPAHLMTVEELESEEEWLRKYE
jgi:hypothetical protein